MIEQADTDCTHRDLRPLAWCQRSIWLDHENSEPGLRHEHNVHETVQLPVRLTDADHKKLILWLVARHETFRTRVHVSLDLPAAQSVHASDPDRLRDLLRCSTLEGPAVNARSSAGALEELVTAPFNLEQDILLRSLLIVSDSSSELNLVMHHIAVDHTSLQIVRDEITDWLDGRADSDFTSDGAIELQCAYEQSPKATPLADHARAYWREQLSICSPTNFPSRPSLGGSRGLVEVVLGSSDLGRSAAELATRLRTTVAGVYLGAFALALSAVTKSPTIGVKALWFNRAARWQHSLVTSRFLPTLVVLDLASGLSLCEIAPIAGSKALGAGQYGYAPYDELLEEVALAAGRRNAPIDLGTVFNFLPASVADLANHPEGVQVSSTAVANSAEHCIFSVAHSSKGARLEITAQRELMSEDVSASIAQCVANVITNAHAELDSEHLDQLKAETSGSNLAPGLGWVLLGQMWVDIEAVKRCMEAINGVQYVIIDEEALSAGELAVKVGASAGLMHSDLTRAFRSDMYHFAGVRTPDRIDLVSAHGDAYTSASDVALLIPAELSQKISAIAPGVLDGGASWCEAGGRYLDIPRVRRLAAEYGVTLPPVHEIGTAIPFASFLQ